MRPVFSPGSLVYLVIGFYSLILPVRMAEFCNFSNSKSALIEVFVTSLEVASYYYGKSTNSFYDAVRDFLGIAIFRFIKFVVF